ncbi:MULTISPECIES: toll/interleukin-1 receptor domain-containing protein [Streptomyces]|uniref:toll/interleukin-1 receptor domain-containing protein n=1 Tax=Streptomyces TaxID=1883 RepID=UPI00099E04C4|nr:MULTISPECIES: toll/interleukin-1 receptor domain-containing protein [Streptomyces]WTF73150.1 toll/interleukin-1 receptor domain-containing protein [Streptomyces microflavus]
MSLRIFISHGAGRDADVRSVLENIVPRLTASGYDVFVDVEKLRAGDEWHEVPYREMYRCDAAIVLLGPETVAAPRWVRREAEVLVGRFKVGGLAAVLPGIVGDVSTAEARKPGFDALLSIQAAVRQTPDGERLKGADTLTVADRIMAAFSPQDLRSANPGARDWGPARGPLPRIRPSPQPRQPAGRGPPSGTLRGESGSRRLPTPRWCPGTCRG